MRTRWLALLAITVLQACSAGELWIAAHPVTMPGLAEATAAAAAPPWIAFVEVLPLPKSHRGFHAPRPPWRLVRAGPDGVPEVVADADAATGGGWGAPSFVAVADDGTVAATWRPGHEILIAPPKQKAVQYRVHDDGSRSCIALSTDWILHRHDSLGTLCARRLTASGLGDDVPLGPAAPKVALGAVFGAPWLAWIDPSGNLAAIDVSRGEQRSVAPPSESLSLDGIWNGHLLMHNSMSVHVVDLDRAVCRSMPAPDPVTWCVPEGAFAHGGLWNPVDGTFLRVERFPAWHGISQVLRCGQGVLWIRERPRREWHELRTLADPVAMRDSPPPAPLPEVPPQPTGATGDAVRAAWRATRGH